MEPISEGKHILSDIEKAIQNALSLFSTKDIGGVFDKDSVKDEPIKRTGGVFDQDSILDESIASFQVPYQQNQFPPYGGKTRENSPEFIRTNEPLLPKINRTLNTEPVYNEFPFRNSNLSHESVKLPFLEDPIKNTVEEMQRVLNSRGDSFTPKVEPSPEEILNLFSQDLGICTSSKSSPRVDGNRADSLELYQAKLSKKDKKHINKVKQEKLKQGKKTQERKGKSYKPSKPEEEKLKELINIYGRPDQIKKPYSDSTLGSKSEVSRNPSIRKLKNDVSKADSVAVSKKSKRKKQKFPKNIDMDLCNEYLAHEKSSKISSKRKKKNSNVSLLKKTSMKRRTTTKLYGDKEDQDKSLAQNDHFGSTGKNKMIVENGYWHSMKSKEKPFRKSERDSFFYHNRGSHNTDQAKPARINKYIYNAGSGKKLYGKKVNSAFQDINPNKNEPVYEPTSVNSSEQVLSSLNRKISEESKLNKHVLFYDSTEQKTKHITSDIQVGKNAQESYDVADVDFSSQPTQYHYTLPTQSSRSKEVERFLNGHYQHLPFVIGQSTNKSHNLWVNIQEALSLIKQKVPQTAEVVAAAPDANSEHPFSERPLSVISKFTSKSSKKPHVCQAHTSEGLYDIPESAEIEDISGKSWEDHPECMQANIDPNRVRPRCSCTSQASMSYRKVLSQIFGGDSVDFSETSSGGAREDLLQDQGGDNYRAELRKMLQDLAQEFEELNRKYEQMVMDPNAPKEELDQLEALLENKEEEIRDIINRFNEVKEATERAHIEGHRSRASFGNVEPYKSTTSIRLAQTLRRVQRFKDSLRSRPSMPHLSKSIYAQSSY